jgi:hypothetical protein
MRFLDPAEINRRYATEVRGGESLAAPSNGRAGCNISRGSRTSSFSLLLSFEQSTTGMP